MSHEALSRTDKGQEHQSQRVVCRRHAAPQSRAGGSGALAERRVQLLSRAHRRQGGHGLSLTSSAAWRTTFRRQRQRRLSRWALSGPCLASSRAPRALRPRTFRVGTFFVQNGQAYRGRSNRPSGCAQNPQASAIADESAGTIHRRWPRPCPARPEHADVDPVAVMQDTMPPCAVS